MKYIYLKFSALFLLFYFLLLTNLSAQTNYSKEVEEKIYQFEHSLSNGLIQIDSLQKWTIEQRMKFYKINGLSIAFVHDYKIEWAKGYGWADVSEKRTVTAETFFQAASIGKSLNSIGVLKLAQEKKLDLYADINNYLTSWKFPYDSVSKGKKITTVDLLSHTAGLSVHGFIGYKPGEALPNIIEVLDGKRPANSPAVRSLFQPGLKFQYSGGGIVISQLIVENITGESYENYMKKNVLDPIGMSNTYYTFPIPKEGQKSNLATAYYNNGKEVNGKFHIYPVQAVGSSWTTPTDIAKYIIETQLSLLGKSNKVLTQEMTQLYLTPYIDRNSAPGTFVYKRKGGEKYFTHNGRNEGFVSVYFGSIENGNGIVMMANSESNEIFSEIANAIALTYDVNLFDKPIVKKTMSIEKNLLDSYVGKYEKSGAKFVAEIRRSGDHLKIQGNGNVAFDVYPQGNNMFFATVDDIVVEFIADEKGKFIKMVARQNQENTEFIKK